MIELTPIQKLAVENHLKVLENNDFTLDASKTGLGKTIISLFVAKILQLPVGVICRANARTQWQEECKKCGVENVLFIESYNKMRNGSNSFLRKEVYKSTSSRKKDRIIFKWQLEDRCLLIFDEVQDCAGLGTLNAKMLEAAFKHGFPKIMGLSATVAATPLRLSVVGYCLGLHHGTDWYHWCFQMGAKKGYFGGLTFKTNPGSRAEESLKNIHSYIFPGHGYRLTYDSLKDEMPQNNIRSTIINISSYKNLALVKEKIKIIDDKELEEILEANENEQSVQASVSHIRQRQREEIYKIPWLLEESKNNAEQKLMTLIFVQWDLTRVTLLKELSKLGLNFMSYSGRDSHDAKNEARTKCLANTIDGLVINAQAGSASLNLQDKVGTTPRITYLLPMYSAEQLIQTLGRAYRIDSKSHVNQFLVYADSPLERRIFRTITQNIDHLELLNDGDLIGSVFSQDDKKMFTKIN